MKMVLVVYGSEADEEVVGAFKAAGIVRYTKFCEARGVGTETEPKLASRVWPGKNNVLLIGVADQEMPGILEVVHELKREHPRTGVKAFVMPVEELA